MSYVTDRELHEALDRVEAMLWAKAEQAARFLHGLEANGYRCLARDVAKVKRDAEWEVAHRGR